MIIPQTEAELIEITQLTAGRMLELGSKANKAGTYKSHFRELGWDHVSVDINAEHGSLNRDLTTPGVLADLGQFDIVTNFGTTEHVVEQAPCWRNIHNAIADAGWLVCVTPGPGTWEGHGFWYPFLDWYSTFARLNHYTVWHLSTIEGPMRTGTATRLNRFVAQKLPHVPFDMPPLNLMRQSL